ncbi:hypothetical protein K488DRAFT_90913 [Vararia minispora EC-137]|uniref:Uncharacterized protein n=1 Tax=Vararia minispora EC-137 TaxID=1314806 RepID=A0ACB8Q6V4_9AGAM|nr:hypothetical protein K488DRAFT_90913 [Vararia minispora EC-137]
MYRLLLATAPFVVLASAFSDTYPVVAWSSHKTSVLDGIARAPTALGDLFMHMLSGDDVCSYDAIVLVEQPGLHATDLRTLAPTSPLTTLLTSAPSSAQIPYARRSPSHEGLHDLAQHVAHRCGARLASVVPGQSDLVLESATKHVVNMYLPELEDEVRERKEAVATNAHAFSEELAALTAALPKHLVIITGAPVSSLSRRQSVVTSPSDTPEPLFRQSPVLAAFEQPKGGVLARYQLLTPALITALLIGLFVLLPALVFAISALASIQSPMRVEAPKGYNAQEKKTQ